MDAAITAAAVGRLDDETRANALHAAHAIVGSAGSFGFLSASQLAREIMGLVGGDAPVERVTAARLLELAAALRRELQRPPTGALATLGGEAESARLLIAIDEDALAERLALEAARHGLRVELVASIAAARAAIARAQPDVVVFDLGLDHDERAGQALLAELAARVPPVPALVLSARAGLEERLAAAQFGATGFLQTPTQPAQVLDAVATALARRREAGATIMTVDDDPIILTFLRTWLTRQGHRVIALDDPRRFWEVLVEAEPEILILDVTLPELNGLDLCRVVRQDARWGALPVLVLTAHDDSETVRRAFAAGADDFVTKPVVGPELLARVAGRLERARLLRRLAEADGLTGVANRRASSQRLAGLLALAARQGHTLSLAALDVDHFKQVNDRHGHAAGDAVLQWLGDRLLGMFRGEDVVGRWGGEEFVIGLYGSQREDGVRRLGEALARLRGHEFVGARGERFRVTASAGVAEFPSDGTDVQSLYRAADAALYRAKAAGRDRVLRADGPARGD